VIKVIDFEPQLASSLPTTHALLKSSNFTLHPAVSRIILHGSRGPAGGYRPDSDIDLSLIVDTPPGAALSEVQVLLQDVLEMTLSNWQCAVEIDLAVVFDVRNCGLKCFEQTAWDEQLCTLGGVDCFGLYKVQRGFNGFVTNAGVQVKWMYPCLKVWQRI
jgi:hypothetical protein